jgi:hypothetical protein
MTIEKTCTITSYYDQREDWNTDFAWALPEGHVLIEVCDVICYDRYDLKHHEYIVELTHAPEAEALAYFCARAGATFVPAA